MRLMAAPESSADGAELLRSLRIMAAAAILCLNSCVLSCDEADGSCGDGGEGPALRENMEDSSCNDELCELSGVRMPESKFCIWANCCKLKI